LVDRNEPKKTKVVHNNGFNPEWKEKFEFKVHLPDLALLEIQVVDNNTGKNRLIGINYLPMHLINVGYRLIPLYSQNGDDLRNWRTITLH